MNFLEYSPVVLAQTLHFYYIDWIAANRTWQGTIVCKRKNIPTPQILRNNREVLPRVLDGGWHFTWMGGIDRVIEKTYSTVESYLLLQTEKKVIDREYIQGCMKNGNFLDDPNYKIESYDINKIKLPMLKDFLIKYPQFLRETDI